jgi:hypothetical protein
MWIADRTPVPTPEEIDPPAFMFPAGERFPELSRVEAAFGVWMWLGSKSVTIAFAAGEPLKFTEPPEGVAAV